MEHTTERLAVESRPWHYGLVVLGLIVLAVFASLGLGRFGYSSILPAMQDALQLTNTQTGELQSWNLLGYLLAALFAGMLAARNGPRAVVSIALLVVGLSLIFTGLVSTFDGARVGRFLSGVGGAGANVPAMALIAAWFGARRRGLAAGAGVAGSSLGLMVTGPLVPAILNRFGPDGWRVSWYVLGALGLSAAVLCALGLRNRPYDMGLTPLGANETESQRTRSEPAHEQSEWSVVYRSRLLWQLAAIYFTFGFSYAGYSTFFVRYLVKEAGFSLDGAGTLWLQVGVVTALSGFIWGGISDRWGRRAALVGVLLLQGFSFAALGVSREVPAVYVSAALFALTAWSVPALMVALCGDLFGARLAATALGAMTVVFGIGQAIAPYLAGAIADATQSFALAFILAGAVAWLGAGGAVLIRPAKT